MSTNLKELPPGPKGAPVIGCSDEFKNDPLGFVEKCHKEYGDFVPFSVGPYQCVLISDVNMIQEVLVSQSAHFTKDPSIRNNREFFGEGLLGSEGDLWKRQRKLVSAAFSPKRLEGYSKVMVDHAKQMVDRFHDGQTVDMQHEMMRLTLGVATKALFDSDLSSDNHEVETALNQAQTHLSERMIDPLILFLPEWVPFPVNVHLHEAIKTVDHALMTMINERRGNCEGRNDLLSILLSAKDEEDGTTMSDKLIRDEVFTMFFAGHETTALTLSWTLYLLAKNPDAEAKLVEELNRVLGGREPAFADHTALVYAEKVIRETMRVRPPVWAIGREAASDCVIGGYPIKKGSSVTISQWILHHDERYYDEPLRFNPDRWTDEFKQNLPKFAYFPFGGGPRVCIGNGFAMIEALLLLASIVQKFHVTLTDPAKEVQLNPAVTLRPVDGIPMTLHLRK